MDATLKHIVRTLEVQVLALDAILNPMIEDQSPDSVQVQKFIHSIANIAKAVYTLKKV